VIDPRLLICAAVSVIGHFALAKALERLPERPAVAVDRKIEVRVVAPPAPPPPEPPKAPEPTPEPVPVVKPVPQVAPTKATPRRVQPTVQDVIPPSTPVAPNAAVVEQAATTPVFGVTLESTSTGGKGPAMPVGNTAAPTAGPATATGPGPQAAPAAAAEVTKMPLPQGRCSGKYTDAARAAALEGTVVLDLIVDERGRARDIRVVEGLGHGLTEAAVAALKDCRFTPGERAGQPVPVRVRSFKIRFVMQDAQ
jgi:periplasmic protein TonB